ncbi:hypothetical protein DEU56DRAFT_760992 [Suillus clintonianus]|uniref:uncharacterized protein n=1 Tax=Suillus clintonianus TaxID=1904413 RepID=UPI001B85CC7F|nr:uncharacterized protein DEU56DRAFT_760992 [Suillus clintonianus]KAG2119412.1 hypothetical protein DEU56DRAFT_760992 [Suillus clintonianus]
MYNVHTSVDRGLPVILQSNRGPAVAKAAVISRARQVHSLSTPESETSLTSKGACHQLESALTSYISDKERCETEITAKEVLAVISITFNDWQLPARTSDDWHPVSALHHTPQMTHYSTPPQQRPRILDLIPASHKLGLRTSHKYVVAHIPDCVGGVRGLSFYHFRINCQNTHHPICLIPMVTLVNYFHDTVIGRQLARVQPRINVWQI